MGCTGIGQMRLHRLTYAVSLALATLIATNGALAQEQSSGPKELLPPSPFRIRHWKFRRTRT